MKEKSKTQHRLDLIEDDGIFKVDLTPHIFQEIYSWDECRQQSTTYETEDIEVRVVHINHLIKMKENAKRMDNNLKDLVDAAASKKIKKLEAEKNKKSK